MASISAFMAGGQRQYPSHYMETSISTYIDACRQHQFATRATLFGVEAFKSRGMYSEAAFALLKMTGEVRFFTLDFVPVKKFLILCLHLPHLTSHFLNSIAISSFSFTL